MCPVALLPCLVRSRLKKTTNAICNCYESRYFSTENKRSVLNILSFRIYFYITFIKKNHDNSCMEEKLKNILHIFINIHVSKLKLFFYFIFFNRAGICIWERNSSCYLDKIIPFVFIFSLCKKILSIYLSMKICYFSEYYQH